MRTFVFVCAAALFLAFVVADDSKTSSTTSSTSSPTSVPNMCNKKKCTDLCEDGLCCNGKCVDSTTVKQLAVGDKCDATSICKGACAIGSTCVNNKCEYIQPVGCSCAADTECYAATSTNLGATPTCSDGGMCIVNSLGAGEACMYSEQCASGHCKYGTCEGYGKGHPCVTDASCANKYVCCNGECLDKVATGKSCEVTTAGDPMSTDNCDKDDVCSGGKCVARNSIKKGKSCDTRWDEWGVDLVCEAGTGCNAGKCTTYYSVAEKKECVETPASMLSFCSAGLACLEGTCTDTSGQTCLPGDGFGRDVGCSNDQVCTCKGGDYKCDKADNDLVVNTYAAKGDCLDQFNALVSAGGSPNLAAVFMSGPTAGSTELSLDDQTALAEAVCCSACAADTLGSSIFSDDVVAATPVKYQCAGKTLVGMPLECPADVQQKRQLRSAKNVFHGCNGEFPGGQIFAIILACLMPVLGCVYLCVDVGSGQKEHRAKKRSTYGAV